MTKRVFKFSIALALLTIMIGSALKTEAYPPFLRQASKFGAKNCLFCHKDAQGGEGWNERGQWLIDEKTRRKADAIDVVWLEEYKEPEKPEKKADETVGAEGKEKEPKKEKP